MALPPSKPTARLNLILRNLPHIVPAGEAGSLHRAARRLGIAQSALSRRVADVEAELGGPVFLREPGGVRPTEAGRDLIVEGEQLLTKLDQATRKFALTTDGARHSLRIGFNSAAMMFSASAGALSVFRQSNPRVDLQLDPMLSEAQYEALISGRIDVGIGYQLTDDLPFAHRIIAMDAMVLALPSDHPLAQMEKTVAADIDGLRFVGMQEETSGMLARRVRAHLVDAGVAVDNTLQAGSSEATLNLVAAGLGLAFVNRSQAGRCPPNIHLRPIAGLDLSVPLALMWHAYPANPLLEAFLDSVQTHFSRSMPKSDRPRPKGC